MRDEHNNEKPTKMLGGLVPEDIFWKFKEIASARKESMQDALYNAALLYIDAGKEKKDVV